MKKLLFILLSFSIHLFAVEGFDVSHRSEGLGEAESHHDLDEFDKLIQRQQSSMPTFEYEGEGQGTLEGDDVIDVRDDEKEKVKFGGLSFSDALSANRAARSEFSMESVDNVLKSQKDYIDNAVEVLSTNIRSVVDPTLKKTFLDLQDRYADLQQKWESFKDSFQDHSVDQKMSRQEAQDLISELSDVGTKLSVLSQREDLSEFGLSNSHDYQSVDKNTMQSFMKKPWYTTAQEWVKDFINALRGVVPPTVDSEPEEVFGDGSSTNVIQQSADDIFVM